MADTKNPKVPPQRPPSDPLPPNSLPKQPGK
jgi:hypothetical protein